MLGTRSPNLPLAAYLTVALHSWARNDVADAGDLSTKMGGELSASKMYKTIIALTTASSSLTKIVSGPHLNKEDHPNLHACTQAAVGQSLASMETPIHWADSSKDKHTLRRCCCPSWQYFFLLHSLHGPHKPQTAKGRTSDASESHKIISLHFSRELIDFYLYYSQDPPHWQSISPLFSLRLLPMTDHLSVQPW